jgi:hypothetical protein
VLKGVGDKMIIRIDQHKSSLRELGVDGGTLDGPKPKPKPKPKASGPLAA